MRILFSPVGTADPLTILGDGPMVHLCRHFQPDVVVLYISPKMAEYEDFDNRFERAITLLCEHTGQKMPLIQKYYSDVADVHMYDVFISEFEAILKELSQLKSRNLIVNTSSGTPAMQQALVALVAFGRIPKLKAAQVSTPRAGINKKDDREDPKKYDFETLWELNPDNEPKRSCDRVIEVVTPNFSDMLLNEELRALIKEYNYSAAVTLAQSIQSLSQDVRNLICAADARLKLDGQRAAPAFAKSSLSYDREKALPEYISMLEVRLKQGLWADFTRSVTPAITETLAHLLESSDEGLRTILPRSNYSNQIKRGDGKSDWVLDVDKIHADPRLRRALPTVNDNGGKNYVCNWHLYNLAEEYYFDGSSPQRSIKALRELEKLRPFESISRNRLAHTITSMTKDSIEKESGIRLEEVLDLLIRLNNVQPGLYDRINNAIFESM